MSAQQGFTLWLTGLSGAGKSTIAEALTARLRAVGRTVEVLDGDEVRTHLSKGLGFSREDRDTNIARIAFVASLLTRSGAAVITAAISPYADARAAAREKIGSFVEVYVRCSLEELARRDVKGLYAKAMRGEIAHFTGVSDPYEPPKNPDVVVDSEYETVETSVGKIYDHLVARGLVPGGGGLETSAHGGRLIELLASGEAAAELRREARELPRLVVGNRVLCDLDLLGQGAFSPLGGFMTRADYERVITSMRLANGLPWTIPIVLPVSRENAPAQGSRVALYDEAGALRAVIDVQERFEYDKAREAREVYRTEDAAHPGVAALYAQGDVLLGGPVAVLPQERPLAPYELTPRAAREAFRAKGWRTVVGFQTRNPVHRAHEYIQKCALEIVDGLFLHPLVGETKSDDIPADVRMACYKALLDGYYPPEWVVFGVLPAAMRYAGPREAIFHAIVRKNYGCTHFIVGRDHAGVGNYYGTYDAQKLFDEFEPGELGIVPLKFENSFYCRRCAGMASTKSCPHGAEEQVTLSGTAVRTMLSKGELPPQEFSRPEVARILVDATASKNGKAVA
jgi:sulfate adenylyltransferase/3'-phosphoadenosine 5'-phosphosulfate synthase